MNTPFPGLRGASPLDLRAALATARDPQSPPSRLRELAAGGDPALREAVAVNPNTPLDLLLQLASSCPAAFLANPALELLDLESPGAFASLAPPTALQLLEQPGTPGWLASQLLARSWVHAEHRARLATSAASPGVLAALAAGSWGELQGGLARNPALPEESAHLLVSDPEPATRTALARLTRHPSVLARLADDAHPPARLLARARLQPPSDRELVVLQAHGHESLGQRETQEDAFAIAPLPGAFFALVTDGMGGHRTGKFAAQITAREFPLVIGELAARGPVSEEVGWLEIALAVTEDELGWYAEKHSCRGYGATLAALLICDDRAHLAHVGDSRIYRLRGGILEPMTRDHTLLNDQLKAGLLTPEEAAAFPYKNVITRALGMKAAGVIHDPQTVAIEPGDLFVLCTDGLYGALADEQMAAILEQHAGDAAGAARALVEAAEAAGTKDNTTAVVVPAMLLAG